MYLRFLGFPLSFAQKVAAIVFFTPIAPSGVAPRLRFEATAAVRVPKPLTLP